LRVFLSPGRPRRGLFANLLHHRPGQNDVHAGSEARNPVFAAVICQRPARFAHPHAAAASKYEQRFDADTGYGNAINLMRTIEEFERAGAAAVLLEDQVEPKRCPVGHVVETVPVEEMVGKIRAAVEARKNKDMMIVARTDAKGEEAIRRGKIYLSEGADMIKPGNKCFSTLEEMRHFGQEFPGKSYVSVVAWMEKTLTMKDLVEAGVKIISFPLFLILSTTKHLFENLRYVKEHEWTPVPNDRIIDMPVKKVTSVMFGSCITGRTALISASDLACTMQG